MKRRTVHHIEENSSQKVFQLRKAGQLSEAYELAIKLFNLTPNDEWIQRAYAWVLIDIVKIEISKNSNQALSFFNQLLAVNVVNQDEILSKQVKFLKPKFDSHYHAVSQAEENSKSGNHVQAIDQYRQLQQQGLLSVDHHESFGWAIYRYLKAEEKSLSVDDVKHLLREYLYLKNPRPELLHSIILQFTISYVHFHNGFNLYEFFKLWGPNYLRHDDLNEQYNEGKTYPSLASKLLKEFVVKNYSIDINYLQSVFGNDVDVINTVREGFFWQLMNSHKENQTQQLWQQFENYVTNFSVYGSSHWHSEILKIAERFMTEKDSWRFFSFFQQWGISNFDSSDWREETNGEFTNKALVLKVLKKIFDHSKLDNFNKDANVFNWVLPLYEEALERFNQDVWLLREYANILYKVGKTQEAITLYKQVLLQLGDQAYAWHEFSKLLADSEVNVAISMLCKAITIQKNEDFLGDIHIELAQLLIPQNNPLQAQVELTKYKEHRESKGWKLSANFESLSQQLETNDGEKQSQINNNFYKQNLTLAEEYIYSDIPWTDLLLHDKWKIKEGKEMLAFTDLHDIEFAVNCKKFPIFKKSSINQMYQFKLYFDKEKQRQLVLKVKNSSVSKDDFITDAPSGIAIVDNVNKRKELFHCVIGRNSDGIVKFSQSDLRPQVGSFVNVKYFKTYDKKQGRYRNNILSISPSDKTNPSLIRNVSGHISLKFHDDSTKPAFGFVNDIYVPRYLLEKNKITEDCDVEAKALFNGEKWSVFEIVNGENSLT